MRSTLRYVLAAQITDFHVVEPGELLAERVDTAHLLRCAIAHLMGLDPRPDVVLATGDLVNDGTPDQYRHLGEILAGLELPFYPVPGNHDDRAAIRELLPAGVEAGHGSETVDYVVDHHELRLVALDTTVIGQHGGRLEPEQLSWLDTQLGREPDRPTLVFQHHPPFVTGIDWMDRAGLENGREQAEVLSGHPQVELVTCGHLHRVIQRRFGGTIAGCWPSTGAQLALALDGTPFGYVDEPPAVAVHRWDPAGGVVSHLSYVGGPGPWYPPWAESRSRSLQA